MSARPELTLYLLLQHRCTNFGTHTHAHAGHIHTHKQHAQTLAPARPPHARRIKASGLADEFYEPSTSISSNAPPPTPRPASIWPFNIFVEHAAAIAG